MKIIDLLVKISKGEKVPKKIKYKNEIWKYDKNVQDYYREERTHTYYLFRELFLRKTSFFINDEIEIIEEDTKLEKTELNYLETNALYDRPTLRNVLRKIIEDQQRFTEKINELIDEVNKLKGENKMLKEENK